MNQQQRNPLPKSFEPPPLPAAPGPMRPDVRPPDTNELLKKMRSIERNSGQRYRQRQGE